MSPRVRGGRRLACAHVHGPRTLVPGLGLVADLGAFCKRAKAVADDSALMDKEVLRAIIGSDEAEALLVAEPLHGSGRHVLLLCGYVLRTRRMQNSSDGERGHDLPGELAWSVPSHRSSRERRALGL